MRQTSRITQFALVAMLYVGAVAAQQTIVNVPSDALTPKGQGFVLHESQLLPWTQQADFGSTNFLCYGLTDDTELCLTSYNVDNAGAPSQSLGVGFKSVQDVFQHSLPEWKVKGTYGFMLPVSLGEQAQRVGYFPYAHTSFEIPSTNLRLLCGAAAGSENLFGKQDVSALAGVEYPLTKHLSYTGEWISGNHDLAGLIPGLTYHRERWILVGGYKIPNDFNLQNSALVFEVGVFFGPGANDPHADGQHGSQSIHYGVRPPNECTVIP